VCEGEGGREREGGGGAVRRVVRRRVEEEEEEEEEEEVWLGGDELKGGDEAGLSKMRQGYQISPVCAARHCKHVDRTVKRACMRKSLL